VGFTVQQYIFPNKEKHIPKHHESNPRETHNNSSRPTIPTLRETHTKTSAADSPKNNNNRLIQTKHP
jgi:hypothetical protein